MALKEQKAKLNGVCPQEGHVFPMVMDLGDNTVAIRPLRRDGKLFLSCFGCYMVANNPDFAVR